MLPILHLNGYKIANPTVLARIGDDELTSLLEGYGHSVHWVDGSEPDAMHQRMAAVLDEVVEEIAAIQRARARRTGRSERPRWPMIVLRTPKGWTGPKTVDGLPTEGTLAIAPGAVRRGADERRAPRAARGMAEELPRRGAVRPATAPSSPELAALPPHGDRRMSANPHANGGLLLERPDAARLPRLRRRRAERPARHSPRRPACSAGSCAT